MSGARGSAAAARLEAWLDLAARGWHLFPVRPGTKVPAISGWEQRATTAPDRLTSFYRAHPDHNAGIACGPSGLLVVDCDLPKPGSGHDPADGRDGREVLARVAAEHGQGRVPGTWEVFTSGGAHLYFQAPTGPDAPGWAIPITCSVRCWTPADTAGRSSPPAAPCP